MKTLAFTRIAPLFAVAFVLLIFTSSMSAMSQEGSPAISAGATKEKLIETLDTVLPLLVSKDYEEASQYFVLPPNFKPNMLDGFIDRQELSQSGIRILERDATFGQAKELFGAERAEALANRSDIDVAKCYGFYHETESATAEVIGVWTNGSFKLLRLDDVGKLIAPQAAAAEATTQAAMTKEDVVQKLGELEAAVAANPDDVAARANYAMALNQIGNTPAAWTQLMAAYKLSPSHAGIAKGINVVWGQFATQAVFTVGMPPASIEGLLGEPREKVALQLGQRWVYAFYAIDFHGQGLHETIDLRGATEALFRPTEIITVDLDGRGWQVGSRSKSANLSTALLYIPGENAANWTEQVEIQRILGATAAGTTGEIAERISAQIQAALPESKTKILVETEDSVTIAATLVFPLPSEARHQLIRLFLGPTDVHRLAYTIKGAEPTRETQMKWLEIFQAAKLESVAPPNPDANPSK